MNRLKALFPRLVLVAAGVALGLIARQFFAAPEKDPRPEFSIDRPITEGLELEGATQGLVPLVVPIDPVEDNESQD